MSTTEPQWEHTAAVYLRVSTDNDRQKNSVDVQTEGMKGYALYKGFSIPQELWFADEETGSMPLAKREGGGKLLEALRARKAKHLIVFKLDRLGRQAVDIQQMWHYLTKELRVVVHILDMGGDNLSSDSPMSKVIVGMLSLFAEFERDRIVGRINDTFDKKFAAGECIGHVPFGWQAIETDTITKVGKKLKLIQINPKEQLWMRKIILFRFVGSGDGKGPWSFVRIAKYLTEMGVPTRTGAQWCAATIRDWLKGRHVKRYIDQFYDADARVFRNATVNELPEEIEETANQ
jgi:DNA invertase Pin-like site-specific DNA recombinase